MAITVMCVIERVGINFELLDFVSEWVEFVFRVVIMITEAPWMILSVPAVEARRTYHLSRIKGRDKVPHI